MKTKKAGIFSLPDLESLLAKWQKLLRLQDWRVRIYYARRFDLSPEVQAETVMSQKTKDAIIRILDPIDADPNTFPPQTRPNRVEESIVHELLHFHLRSFFPPPNETNKDEEVAICSIASALMALNARKENG